MLIRDDFREILSVEERKFVLNHFVRACNLRLDFIGLTSKLCPEGKSWMPSCHEVAHAYAKAFDVEAVDGECAYFKANERRTDGTYIVDISTVTHHSWCRLRVNESTAMILDVYPDAGLPVMPVLLFDPHPGYWVPEDIGWRNEYKKIQDDITFPIIVAELAEEFRRLDEAE